MPSLSNWECPGLERSDSRIPSERVGRIWLWRWATWLYAMKSGFHLKITAGLVTEPLGTISEHSASGNAVLVQTLIANKPQCVSTRSSGALGLSDQRAWIAIAVVGILVGFIWYGFRRTPWPVLRQRGCFLTLLPVMNIRGVRNQCLYRALSVHPFLGFLLVSHLAGIARTGADLWRATDLHNSSRACLHQLALRNTDSAA